MRSDTYARSAGGYFYTAAAAIRASPHCRDRERQSYHQLFCRRLARAINKGHSSARRTCCRAPAAATQAAWRGKLKTRLPRPATLAKGSPSAASGVEAVCFNVCSRRARPANASPLLLLSAASSGYAVLQVAVSLRPSHRHDSSLSLEQWKIPRFGSGPLPRLACVRCAAMRAILI